MSCTVDAVRRVRRWWQVMIVIRRTRHIFRIGVARTIGVVGVGWFLSSTTISRWTRTMVVQVIRANCRCWDGRARRISGTRTRRLLLAIQDKTGTFGGRQHIVYRDDTVWSRTSWIMHNGHVRLHPYPATGLGQKSVVSCRHLTFAQYCQQGNDNR